MAATSKTNGIGEDGLSEIRRLRQILPSLAADNRHLRDEMLGEIRQLMIDLETPWHTIQRIAGVNIWEAVVVNIATNMGLFKTLASSSEPLSPKALAGRCSAELVLVQRILRCLASLRIVNDYNTPEGCFYSRAPVSETFASPEGIAATRCFFEFAAPAWLRLPAQLHANGYKNLQGSTDTVFNQVYNLPGKSVWEIIGTTGAEYVDDFGLIMANFNVGHRDWLDFYPVEERLVSASSHAPDAIFMVDIGGWTGSQAIALRSRFSKTPGRFIVQDLPHALPKTINPEIEFYPHSFFEPQPGSMHGARLYYMRYISHDWSQSRLVQILSVIALAMKPGYSKLIIHDWIVPETNVPVFMATQDLNMMTLGGGEERTEKRHREAVEAAGLKVTGVWDPKDGVSEGIIECELK